MPTPNLVTLTDPRSPASEAFRTLRTNVIFSALSAPLDTLLVTSPAPEDGKSTALANLAVTMAQGGKQTILVDTDLRRPAQHEIWDIDQEPGLTNMVLDGLTEPPLVEVGVENLLVLTSGPLPSNPADLLGSPVLDKLISDLVSRADIVLFDAPPVMAVTDAPLLASKLDGVLMVLRAGSTRRDHAERAKELLDRIGVRLIGAALTNARAESGMGAYY